MLPGSISVPVIGNLLSRFASVSRKSLPNNNSAITKKVIKFSSINRVSIYSNETRLQANLFFGIKRCFSLILSSLQRRVSFLAKPAAQNESSHAHLILTDRIDRSVDGGEVALASGTVLRV